MISLLSIIASSSGITLEKFVRSLGRLSLQACPTVSGRTLSQSVRSVEEGVSTLDRSRFHVESYGLMTVAENAGNVWVQTSGSPDTYYREE